MCISTLIHIRFSPIIVIWSEFCASAVTCLLKSISLFFPLCTRPCQAIRSSCKCFGRSLGFLWLPVPPIDSFLAGLFHLVLLLSIYGQNGDQIPKYKGRLRLWFNQNNISALLTLQNLQLSCVRRSSWIHRPPTQPTLLELYQGLWPLTP